MRRVCLRTDNQGLLCSFLPRLLGIVAGLLALVGLRARNLGLAVSLVLGLPDLDQGDGRAPRAKRAITTMIPATMRRRTRTTRWARAKTSCINN